MQWLLKTICLEEDVLRLLLAAPFVISKWKPSNIPFLKVIGLEFNCNAAFKYPAVAPPRDSKGRVLINNLVLPQPMSWKHIHGVTLFDSCIKSDNFSVLLQNGRRLWILGLCHRQHPHVRLLATTSCFQQSWFGGQLDLLSLFLGGSLCHVPLNFFS